MNLTNKRLVCIRTIKLEDGGNRYRRLPKVEAQLLVDSGEWCFISKGKYRRYCKHLTKIDEQEVIKAEQAIVKPAKQQMIYEYDKPKVDKDNLSYDIHESIIYESESCHTLGTTTKSKQGKGKVIKTIRYEND